MRDVDGEGRNLQAKPPSTMCSEKPLLNRSAHLCYYLKPLLFTEASQTICYQQMLLIKYTQ